MNIIIYCPNQYRDMMRQNIQEYQSTTSSTYPTKHDYSLRGFVVRNYTAEDIPNLKLLGGFYNANLKGGPGYIFSKRRHSQAVENYIKQRYPTLVDLLKNLSI